VSGTYSTGTLAAPTAVSAAKGSCVAPTSTAVNVNWTATTSVIADGYEVLRSVTSGSGHATVGSVSGRNTISFTDTSPAVPDDLLLRGPVNEEQLAERELERGDGHDSNPAVRISSALRRSAASSHVDRSMGRPDHYLSFTIRWKAQAATCP